jgi:hypothetical protein
MYKHRSAWNDYFSGTSQPQVILQQTTRQTPTNQCVHILNCLFQSITATSNGGAVYCSTSVAYLLVESSSFFSCKTSGGQGGAIYFSNTNSGQSVLHTVCGYDCNSGTSWGQQICILLYNNALTKNYVNYSSFARCLNEQRTETLSIYNGKVCCPSINVSMNKCSSVSGVYFCAYVDSSSVTCSLSYSSIADNSAAGYNCILFATTGVKYEIKSCNIIRNSQVSSSYGTLWTQGNLMIQDSSILENSATTIFYAYSSYTITISNSTVDKTTKYRTLITQNTVTKSFILGLNHMSTRNCHSEYDSAGYITAAAYIPTRSSTKEVCHCTYRILLYQAKMSDLFSLTYVFMISFIYIDPFVYSWCDI